MKPRSGYFLVISYYVSLIQNCIFHRNCLPNFYHICLIFLTLKFTVFFLLPAPFSSSICLDKKLSRAEFVVNFLAQTLVVTHFINLEKGQLLIKSDFRI